MADDTSQTGSDVIATDHVTSLNGTPITPGPTTPKVQRVKAAFGDDGTSRDVSAAFPLPTMDPDGTVTGTITATDTVLGVHSGNGAVLTGTPTANSYVTYALKGGESGFTLRLSGTFGGGTVWMESSVDSTNGIDGGWTTNLVRQSGVDATTLDTSLTAPGIFRGVAAGYSYLRVRITGATAPSVTVSLRASAGTSLTAQVASLPPGNNTIGGVNLIGSGGLPTVAGAITAAGTNTPGTQSIASTTGQVVASAALAGNATFHVVTSAFVGTLVFEGSVDGGLNYGPIIAIREDGTGSETTVAINTATYFIRQYTVALPGFMYFRVRASVFTSGSAAIIIAPGPFLIEPSPSLGASTATVGALYPAPSYTVGTATGTTAAASGQIGRVVRASANVAQTTAATLIAAPAAGLRLYVTNITCTNEGATLTVLRLFAGTLPAAAGAVAVINDCFDFAIAASGGGAGLNFPPTAPWALPVATALSFAVTVATTWDVSVSYYVSP